MWTDSGGTRHKTIHTSTEQDIVAYNLQLLIQQNTIVEPCVGAVGRGGGGREERWDIGREEANCNFFYFFFPSFQLHSSVCPQSSRRIGLRCQSTNWCLSARFTLFYPSFLLSPTTTSLHLYPSPLPHLSPLTLPLSTLPPRSFFFVRHSFRPPAHRATVATYSA